MSEYWKSTPKYWCKHCSGYVKDTPFERKQHESTGKHQGNLKRFLRDIQNDHEKGEREKQKAKDEVERLNRLTGSGTSQPIASASAPTVRNAANSALTAADQKRQWQQLADMGIQVPQGFRGEIAMAGEWQPIHPTSVVNQCAQESLSTGIRKRKLDDEEEQDDMPAEPRSRRVWGKTTRCYPGEKDDDLDALLSAGIPLKHEVRVMENEGVKDEVDNHEDDAKAPDHSTEGGDEEPQSEGAQLTNSITETASERAKEEPPQRATKEASPLQKAETVDAEDSRPLRDIPEADPAPVFKKRKAKIAR